MALNCLRRCPLSSFRRWYFLTVTLVSVLVIFATLSFRWRWSKKGVKIISNQTVLVVVAIHSAPMRTDRRNAIRETWKRKCEKNAKVVCWFFTDGQDPNGNVLHGEVRSNLENERLVYGDILLAQTPGGLNFANRYLWMAEWVTQRYNFQYLLYVDDDYFLCLDKITMEADGYRPTHNFIWGWLHCEGTGIMSFTFNRFY